jgi:signal transduction histidine kinase
MSAEAVVVFIAAAMIALPIIYLCIGNIRHKIAKKKLKRLTQNSMGVQNEPIR